MAAKKKVTKRLSNNDRKLIDEIFGEQPKSRMSRREKNQLQKLEKDRRQYFQNFQRILSCTGVMRKSTELAGSSGARTATVAMLENGELELLLSEPEFRFVYRKCERKLKEQRNMVQRALNERIDYLTSERFGKINGYCVGFRRKHGHVVAPLQYVIQMHVNSKQPDDVLERKGIRKLPKTVSTRWRGRDVRVPVKVIETCPKFASGATSAIVPMQQDGWLDDTDGKVQGGEPIAPQSLQFNWGTFGMKIPLQNGTSIGVTNAHVVLSSNAPMLNPPDGRPESVFGEVEDWTFDRPMTDVFKADAAKISLNDDGRVEDGIRDFPQNLKFLFPKQKFNRTWKALKYGAGTQRRIEVSIENTDFLALDVDGRTFSNVIQIKGNDTIIKGGDSGSMLVVPVWDVPADTPNSALASAEKAFLVVGLVFAKDEGSNRFGFACHWLEVAKQLGIYSRRLKDYHIKHDLLRDISKVKPCDKFESWFTNS